MNIQWYPGHMAKTKRLLAENLSLVDVVIELLDARIPHSSQNPQLGQMAANKHRIILLNKSDLADTKTNTAWLEYFESIGIKAILTNAQKPKTLAHVYPLARELMKEKIERDKQRGRVFRPIRAMIVGIPNVGKSTYINKTVGKDVAKAADTPGVTRGKQWIRITPGFELLDTPGILWPKFDDQEVGLNLAFTGAINDLTLDRVELAGLLGLKLLSLYPESLARFAIDCNREWTREELLEQMGRSRGFLRKGNEVDLMRTAQVFLDEFRGGKLGQISLERPTI